MELEVYCDESHPDAFASKHPKAKYLMIGSLWLPAELREDIKDRIKELRAEHNIWGEIKWQKISHAAIPFYYALIDLFMSYKLELRFRCIAVDREQMNMQLNNNDAELGFYKFYYQLLHHWILDFNSYAVFCDIKTNRDPDRLSILQRCLSYSNLSSTISTVQSLPSKEVVLIQLSDFLLGAVSSRMNSTLSERSAKSMVVDYLETKLKRKLTPTVKTEEKYNIFKIILQGGW